MFGRHPICRGLCWKLEKQQWSTQPLSSWNWQHSQGLSHTTNQRRHGSCANEIYSLQKTCKAIVSQYSGFLELASRHSPFTIFSSIFSLLLYYFSLNSCTFKITGFCFIYFKVFYIMKFCTNIQKGISNNVTHTPALSNLNILAYFAFDIFS